MAGAIRSLHESRKLQVNVHPEVLQELKIAAIREDRTIGEQLHMLLCHELGLEHLTMPDPDAAPQTT